ncbi:cytidyltransferase-related domain protein [Anaerococcus tetradius ATCC 35098]|uniref:tRNA(Met) cytidine acetate ligase n=2 Tax=Anaerococcus tetradius TaxID=33036 RepID=C2CFC2_9FIRM|nr:cytidyltransferase-related domain protein [Anaerococcus tetradius ATCC 35098]
MYNKDGDNMKKLAIISEFNPFHNGHKYLIEQARRIIKPDLAVSLMSGDFVQRGEAAIIDKFARANVSLACGFDLVIEMPNFISLQSAEFFAYKSCELLDKIGITYIAFGIENMDPDVFLTYVSKIISNDSKIEKLTRKFINENYSFTEARYLALKEFLSSDYFISSNNILALEYMRSISKLSSKIKAIPIRRMGANNSDLLVEDKNFASSTAIRMNLNRDIRNLMPKESNESLNYFFSNHKKADYDLLLDIFKYKLLIKNDSMEEILCYEEGMDNFFRKLLSSNLTYDTFINACKSQRHSKSRMKRLMLNYILDNKKDLNELNYNFIKVLAFNNEARQYFREINEKIKVVMRKSDTKKLDSSELIIYESMIKSSNLYSLLSKRDLFLDYKNPIKIQKNL